MKTHSTHASAAAIHRIMQLRLSGPGNVKYTRRGDDLDRLPGNFFDFVFYYKITLIPSQWVEGLEKSVLKDSDGKNKFVFSFFSFLCSFVCFSRPRFMF